MGASFIDRCSARKALFLTIPQLWVHSWGQKKFINEKPFL